MDVPKWTDLVILQEVIDVQQVHPPVFLAVLSTRAIRCRQWTLWYQWVDVNDSKHDKGIGDGQPVGGNDNQ